MVAYPKPEPRTRIKARADRQEAKIVKLVRAACVARDGYCLVRNRVSDCDGPSEWAHAHSHRRSKTRGQPPEVRHTTAASFMVCKKHHDLYDARTRSPRGEATRLQIVPETAAGFDGSTRVF